MVKKLLPKLKRKLQKKLQNLKSEGKKIPHLAAILVGNNGSSETYVANKVKDCEEVGFKSTLLRFGNDVSRVCIA